jgi:hypothetical protein
MNKKLIIMEISNLSRHYDPPTGQKINGSQSASQSGLQGKKGGCSLNVRLMTHKNILFI